MLLIISNMESLEQPAVLDKEMSVNDTIADLVKTLTDEKKRFDDVLKNTLSTLKNLQRDVKKMKPKKRAQSASPDPEHKRTSGLDKPVLVSQELRDLLCLEDKEYPRSEVNSRVTAYIKEHQLQNPDNKREMLLDTTPKGMQLKEVLKPDQPLTFFNIQRYLKVHLIKPPEDISLQVKNQVFVDKMVDELNELMHEIPKTLASHDEEDEHQPESHHEDTQQQSVKRVVKKKVSKPK